MPKQQKDIRQFLQQSRAEGAKYVKVKKSNGVTKFKLRQSKYLYTFVVRDTTMADKIMKSFPPNLMVKTISKNATASL